MPALLNTQKKRGGTRMNKILSGIFAGIYIIFIYAPAAVYHRLRGRGMGDWL